MIGFKSKVECRGIQRCPNLPGQWLQYQAIGSNVRRVLRKRAWQVPTRPLVVFFSMSGLDGPGAVHTALSEAQGRSTKIISMIKWIWTSRLSIKNSLSLRLRGVLVVTSPPGAPHSSHTMYQLNGFSKVIHPHTCQLIVCYSLSLD